MALRERLAVATISLEMLVVGLLSKAGLSAEFLQTPFRGCGGVSLQQGTTKAYLDRTFSIPAPLYARPSLSNAS